MVPTEQEFAARIAKSFDRARGSPVATFVQVRALSPYQLLKARIESSE